MQSAAAEQVPLNSSQDEKNLAWMYKNSNQILDREEYLLGKRIDRSFEQLVQAQKNPQSDSNALKNHLDHECIPPSLRSYSGNEQVDLVRKMQEDPLFAIRKRETETRDQLLKNPVKLKQLRLQLQQQNMGCKLFEKCGKRYFTHTKNDELQLNMFLIGKYKELKEYFGEHKLMKLLKGIKYSRNKAYEVDTTNSNSKLAAPRQNKTFCEEEDGAHVAVKLQNFSSQVSKLRLLQYSRPTRTKLDPSGDKSKENSVLHSKQQHNRRQRLTEKDKEKLRQEMIENATWRSKEHKKNARQHYEDEMRELNSNKISNADEFIRKQLAVATDLGSVAQRIKSNVNNIQRCDRAMSTHFAKR